MEEAAAQTVVYEDQQTEEKHNKVSHNQQSAGTSYGEILDAL